MNQRERDYAAYLEGIKSARSLAHRSRVMAQIFPKYEAEEMRECSRHFARAREYLERARGMRPEAVR